MTACSAARVAGGAVAAALLLVIAAATALAPAPRAAIALAPAGAPEAAAAAWDGALDRKHHKKKKPKPYTSPSGLFIQERASKGLPGPGQHFSFGALKPWDDILELLDDDDVDRKLLLVVRHGQAVSNYLSDTLGPDEWFGVEGTCNYTDRTGVHWDIFDADLTDLGTAQAQSLNSMLAGGGCLNTAANVLKALPLNATSVEELVRETLGEDTCDARRSASDPPKDAVRRRRGGDAPCEFDRGLRSSFPGFKFRVWEEDEEDRGFGLLGDGDGLWYRDTREQQQHQVKRARRFLDILFNNAPEKVVVIVTHSGFARSLLLAVEREPYRPNNAEMVPVIVDRNDDYRRLGLGADDEDEDGAWGRRGAAAATAAV
ncbi:hypothetical protein Rsub_10444 [Raphidocelis subcapitata]|uniref:Phosphoglycerate mutase n=1 Tax=Raphidocelis subcapitata TaxID=307507 RepID=A0A2V0PCE6_9CHLO|nr:hypothetical protein Rsub_10444 [Raphidocelis subcapitata]|eukprot:GBF97521.1 hypothetical protein Rsub_10444 [Raphidocelis subcapitata]